MVEYVGDGEGVVGDVEEVKGEFVGFVGGEGVGVFGEGEVG